MQEASTALMSREPPRPRKCREWMVVPPGEQICSLSWPGCCSESSTNLAAPGKACPKSDSQVPCQAHLHPAISPRVQSHQHTGRPTATHPCGASVRSSSTLVQRPHELLQELPILHQGVGPCGIHHGTLLYQHRCVGHAVNHLVHWPECCQLLFY